MRRLIGVAALLALAGCSDQSGDGTEATTADLQVVEEPWAPGAAEPAALPKVESEPPPRGPAQPGEVPVSQPRIAYTYGYTFRLAADEIAEVQERHLRLCRQLGTGRCRVVSLERSAASGDYGTAATTMQVAAPIAPRFGERLVAAAAEQGADMVEKAISGEDLSRQMVDTEARIRTRETLIRRLTELLETRSGNIQQAVEAERAITNAQEELEAARGWMAEMRTRVAMSIFELQYRSGAPLAGGASDPIRSAFAEVGSLFAQSVALLILLIGAILPWAIVLLLIFVAVRAVRRKLEARREAGEAPLPPDEHGEV